MASDADYTTFLESANKKPTTTSSTGASAPSTSQSKSAHDPTKQPSSAVPESLRALQSDKDLVYTSDTDEPFEAVMLNYSGRDLPDAKALAGVLGGVDERSVQVMSVEEFDPRGAYGVVVKEVEAAGDSGEVGCYRVAKGRTRAEYYVLTVREVGGGCLVGVKAKAVES